MISTDKKENFIKSLTEMKLYHQEHDSIEYDDKNNLIEITHKNGNIYSFYIDPIKMNGEDCNQISFINSEGKKRLGIIHSFENDSDIKACLRKVFA